MAKPVLIADVGGTNIRAAVARARGVPESIRGVSGRFSGMAEALRAASEQLALKKPDMCVLAVAGPVEGDQVALTNRAWTFSQRDLRKALGLKRLVVVNDFVAVAHSLPALGSNDLLSLGGGRGDPRATMMVCGPGTGFGMAVLRWQGRKPVASASEAGHMRLGAANADEARVVAHLFRELGPVSVEHAVSGPGLARLHRLHSGRDLAPQAVIDASAAGDSDARASVHSFFRIFGRVAGDLALALDARGGVFITGGVGRALAKQFPGSPFRAAFDEHPPYEARLAAIPVNVILHPEPGMLGCARIAATLL